MKYQAIVHLDWRGDAIAPVDCTVIASERDFLRNALAERDLLVRGQSLCHWAQIFYRGRGRACSHVTSPTQQLQQVCEGLTAAQAAAVVERLQQRSGTLPHPLHPLEVLRVLYPEGPWQLGPSRAHAAAWLIFLETQDIPEDVVPLVGVLAQIWWNAAPHELKGLYAATTSAQAEAELAGWFGLQPAPDGPGGEFPLPIPQRWCDRIRSHWAQASSLNGTAVLGTLDDLRVSGAPRTIISIAADEVARYFASHPDQLTDEIIRRLEPFIGAEVHQQLRSVSPPPEPSDPPQSLPAVFNWFTDEYLPYRQWEAQHGSETAHRRVHTLAATFASAYLKLCAAALNGGEWKERFSFSLAAALQAEHEKFVTLWFVLDGLPYPDADRLIKEVTREARLTLGKLDISLASVPTVTCFCKSALFSGAPPSEVSKDEPIPTFPGAKLLRDAVNWKGALAGATLGDVFVWSILEPDKTYHNLLDSDTVRMHVRGEINVIAEKIRLASLAVPSDLPLRICVATDHGRLLAPGVRRHPIPAGMQAHGRAAWGTSAMTFDESGVWLDEAASVIHLSGDRFNLPADCALAWDGDSFLANDGRSGRDQFSHGGAYPEEVLVPWIEFARDARPLDIQCSVSGSGEAEKPGRLRLEVVNTHSFPIQLERLRLSLKGVAVREVSLGESVPANHHQSFDVPLDAWPSQQQLEEASAILLILRPGMIPEQINAKLTLETQQMYRQSLTLEDF